MNIREYDDLIKQVFSLSEETDVREAAYKSTPSWDSVGHMMLIVALEEKFGITLSPEDMTMLKNYNDGLALLKEKQITFVRDE